MNTLRNGLRTTFKKLRATHPRLMWTFSALVWLPTAVAFTESFYTIMVVSGRSMQPTLNPDDSKWRDVVLFDRYSVKLRQNFNRGDIVALRSPSDSKLLVKRIVALPGDTVKTLPPYPDTEVRIPPGHAWVEGDEPFRSEDSNYFGPVPLALIDSRLSAIVWPMDRWGPIITPSSPASIHKRGGPAWRRERDALDREKRRQARVIPAVSTT